MGVDRLAIFSCDPGPSTGLAWGICDLTADTVVDSMSNRELSGSRTIGLPRRIEGMSPVEVQEAIRHTTSQVISEWSKFVAVGIEEYARDGDVEIEFVCEHFILTGGRGHKPGVEGIFPAFLIGALVGQMPEEDLILQTASTGMKWNTRDHLTRYKAWIVGKEHERAAFAHMAARLHARLR